MRGAVDALPSGLVRPGIARVSRNASPGIAWHPGAWKINNLPHKTVVELLFWNRTRFGEHAAVEFGWLGGASGRFRKHHATLSFSAHEDGDLPPM